MPSAGRSLFLNLWPDVLGPNWLWLVLRIGGAAPPECVETPCEARAAFRSQKANYTGA